MIKQSFLRNYSLSKIYNQAEDEKNKLKVFYLRKVRKILKEKHQKQRATQREKIAESNKEERIKKRLKNKVKTQFGRAETEPNQCEDGRRQGSLQNKQKAKEKADLKIIDLKFKSGCDQLGQLLLKNEILKSLRVKCHMVNMLHSEKTRNADDLQKRNCFLRKNTLSRSIASWQNDGQTTYQNTCRNQQIKFDSEQVGDTRLKAKFILKLKENMDMRRIIAKLQRKEKD